MEQVSNTLKLMSAIGLPTIIGIIAWLINTGRKINILMRAIQAQMRNELLQEYHRHVARGWISEEDLLEWENRYQSYHALGKNGIMDKRREKLMSLPNTPQQLGN